MQTIKVDKLAQHKYRPEIDGLRAIAVISVVLYHAFPDVLPGGFIGVDIFFVISGFLISGILFENLDQKSFTFLDFYSRRVRRIFPALILVLVSCILIGWFLLSPDEYKQLGKHVVGGASFISNLMLWNESGYFDSSADFKPLLHLWSLGIEEQFYIFWPLFLFFIWRRIDILASLLLILFLSFFLNIYSVNTDVIAVFYSPLTRVWELLVGGLLAHYNLYGCKWTLDRKLCSRGNTDLSRTYANATAAIGFILIFGAMAMLSRESVFPGWWALMPTVGTALLIIAGNNSWLNRLALSNRFAVWVGIISYPLYLWHWPLLSLARIISAGNPSKLILFLIIILSILLAVLTYELLEKPIRSGRVALSKTISLSLLMLLIGILGLIVYKKDGYSKRSEFVPYEKIRQSLIEDVSKHNHENCSMSKEYPYQELNKDFFCMQSSENKQQPTNVVIGDSHSYPMYFGLYDKYVVQRGERLVLLGAPGCLPFLNVETYEKGTYGRCRKLMETIIQRVLNENNVKTIVLVNRGALYVSGSGYGDVDLHNMILKSTTSTHAYTNAMIYRGALTNIIRNIQLHKKNIVLILAPPELGFEPKSCIQLRPISLSPRNLENCGIRYKSYITRAFEYRKILLEVSKDQPNIVVVDSSRSICNMSYCSAYTDGHFLYSDNNHLSVYGAKKVIDESFIPF